MDSSPQSPGFVPRVERISTWEMRKSTQILFFISWKYRNGNKCLIIASLWNKKQTQKKITKSQTDKKKPAYEKQITEASGLSNMNCTKKDSTYYEEPRQ